MTGPSLHIPQETMQALLGQAILAGIDQEARDALIQSAINFLVSPRKVENNWNRVVHPSPLEDAFERAVEAYSVEFSRKYIETDETIQGALGEKLAELLGAYKEKIDTDVRFARDLNGWLVDRVLNPPRE